MDTSPNKNSWNSVWLYLSASGSVASLLALVIVLIEKVSPSQIDLRITIWKVSFALISFLAAGGIIVYAFDYIRSAISNNYLSLRKKTFRIIASLCICLLLLAIFIDGIFATLYWDVWLYPIISIIKRAHEVF